MAPRTDCTTRIPSGVASLVTTYRVRVCPLKKYRQLQNLVLAESGAEKEARPGSPALSSSQVNLPLLLYYSGAVSYERGTPAVDCVTWDSDLEELGIEGENLFCFFLITLKPRVERYKSLCASNTRSAQHFFAGRSSAICSRTTTFQKLAAVPRKARGA